MTRWYWFAFLVFMGCQFEASCGGKKLDMEKAKQFVSNALVSNVGAPPDSVTCPKSVKIEKSATFECTAAYGTATAAIAIQQNDEKGNVTITKITGIVVSKRAEETISKAIGEKANVHVTTDCGPRIHPAKAGATFTCTVKDAAGKEGAVKVTVKDADGNVSFETVPTPPR